MILSFCDTPNVMEVFNIIDLIIKIIKIAVPIILIISLMIDYMRAVSNGEVDKVTKAMVNKFVAAILIFLVPTFVSIIFGLFDDNSPYKYCLTPASREEIRQAYSARANSLIQKAEETKDVGDYNAAVTYLSNVKDKEDKEEYNKRLKEVKKKIDEASITAKIGSGVENVDYYRKRAVEILNSNVIPTDAQIAAAAAKVGMTKQEFIDAVEWTACENGHLISPNLYCGGDMELAAFITYLNISGAINVLNIDSGCNHNREIHMRTHEGMTLDYYKNRFASTIKLFYGEYYNTYMKFAVAVAYDLAPVYLWPPHADRIQALGVMNGKMYYTHLYYMPPFNPLGTDDGFVTLRASENPNEPMLNPYDAVELRKQGVKMMDY